MSKIKYLLVLKTLWRVPALIIFIMPLLAPALAYSLNSYYWLALLLINPILLARKTDEITTHFNQPIVQRYRLPKPLQWMETPDEHLPGGLYEPTHALVYKYCGWFIASMYWILLRNVGGGITWGVSIPIGRIYPQNIDFNNADILQAVRSQILIDYGLTPIKWGFCTIHCELTKDFYGTKLGRPDENWRTCDHVAKPELSFNWR